MALLEIASFSPESALVAAGAGADRIELCDNRDAGGTTPPLEWLTRIKASVKIPVFVMIRPRGGDFHFSEAEFETMNRDIDHFKSNADGFVLGILDQDGNVDTERTSKLVQRAKPLPCTFHRAFDETPNIVAALEDVVATGCRALLTSAGAANVYNGLDALQALVEATDGRIEIIPGGGVRLQNLAQIRETSGARVFHSSAILPGEDLPDPGEVQAMKRLVQETHAGLSAAKGAQLTDVAGSSRPDELPTLVSVGVTPIEENKKMA